MSSSEGTTALILFTSPFTKVTCSLWLSESAVRFCTPPRKCVLLLCIQPGFCALLLTRCLKFYRSHQPAFSTVNLWYLFASWWWPASRLKRRVSEWIAWDPRSPPRWKVTSTARALTEYYWWLLLENPAWRLVCSSLEWRGRCSLRQTVPQRQRFVLWRFIMAKTSKHWHMLWGTRQGTLSQKLYGTG